MREECETVNMMECQDDEVESCEDTAVDCDEEGAVIEGEECSEETREECVPMTEEVCEPEETMECTEKVNDDCVEEVCEEVLVEVDTPCEEEEEICQENTKPVCAKSRMNCADEDDESKIVFSEDEEGLKKMTFSGMISNIINRSPKQINLDNEESLPTVTIVKDDFDNILDIEVDGADSISKGCVMIK